MVVCGGGGGGIHGVLPLFVGYDMRGAAVNY